MKTRAAVAWAAESRSHRRPSSSPGRKAGEVLVEIKATGVCHTDAYTLSRPRLRRASSRPSSAMRAPGSCARSAPGVTCVKVGDHVIPLYTPECRQCKTCLSQRSNLCTAIRATQGQGVMPDGTSRFSCDSPNKPLPLHGLLDLLELHRAAGDRGGEGPRGRALRQDLLHRLRRHHRHRRGDLHGQGLAGRQRGGLRPRRHRPQRDPGRAHGGRRQDHRRRPEPGARRRWRRSSA